MFKFILICDEEKLFDGEVFEVKTETENGIITILDKHQPHMSKISQNITYKTTETLKTLDFSEGFLYTNGDVCFAVIDK